MTITQAEAFFSPWETRVEDWESSLSSINQILNLATSSRQLAWRGVVDASFALHSSLFRRLYKATGILPDESMMCSFEQEILARSRRDWRFDNLSALETFAQIQHYGGPTRLLDVTFNPLVALWFAVEQKFDHDGLPMPESDGRLFAFDVTANQIELDDKWGSRELPWLHSQDEWRRERPAVWKPPSYNDRIPAQNSAFLVGGVPLLYKGDNARYYRRAPGNIKDVGTWNVDDVRASTSVTWGMNTLTRKTQARSTPAYTLRIASECKPELRSYLEKSFKYNAATLYPDLFGLATHVANGIDLNT